ncbi:hypothetical protein [Bacillus wiedmannii]|uniref:hypothetical protein n=1 Tax=Bacillus wiedmannii TaxID=1890302 RepID=UPI00103C36FD|nr:hypothetical protein [Bacillus wiedmannii]TCD28095.1 hypothetical protein E0D84_28010 [Bacillus wiedmannii]
MKTLELTFNMKNGMKIEATKKGVKEDVIKELKDSRFLGVEVFGDVVINLEEVLAVEIVEIKKRSTLEEIENAKSILDGFK